MASANSFSDVPPNTKLPSANPEIFKASRLVTPLSPPAGFSPWSSRWFGESVMNMPDYLAKIETGLRAVGFPIGVRVAESLVGTEAACMTASQGADRRLTDRHGTE
jgi:hypothetical protein